MTVRARRRRALLRGRAARSFRFSPQYLKSLAWFDHDQARAPGSLEGALRLPGTTGSYVWAPDTAAQRVTGDLELVFRFSLRKTSGATMYLGGRYDATANRSYLVAIDTANRPILYTTTDGTAGTQITGIATTGVGAPWVTPDTAGWLKITLDVDDGGGNRVYQFHYAADSTTEPAAWTQLGTTVTTAGTTSIFAGTSKLEYGGWTAGPNWTQCAIYRAIVRSGIGGTVVADFDASRFVTGRPDFVDDYSNRWTLFTNSSPGFGCLMDVMLPTGGYPESAGYIRQPGLTPYTQYVSTPDSATLDITGDIEIVMRIAADNWQPTTQQKVAGKWSGGAGDRSWELEIGAGAAGLRLWTSPTGAGADLVNGLSTVPVSTAFNGRAVWIKATLDVDDGAGNRVYKFYTATDDSQTEPAVWTQLGATVTTAGTTSIFAGAGQLNIGANAPPSAFHAFAGKVYRALVRSGIGGTLVADFNASRLPYPYRSYSDTVGSNAGTWTVNGWTPTMVGHAQAGSSAVANSNAPTMLHKADTAYVHLPGASGNYISMPDSAALDPTTELHLVCRVTPDDWTPSAVSTLISKDDVVADRSYIWRLSTTATMDLKLTVDGSTEVTATSSAALPFVDYQTAWLAVTWRASDGRVQFFYAADSATEPASWTQLGTDQTAAVASIWASAQPVRIGIRTTAIQPLAAKVHAAKIRHSIGGPVVADFNAASCAQTGYTDTIGTAAGAWTINRATSGRKSTLVGARTLAVLGTDDYYVMPKGAIPSALAADNASIAVAARPWATMGSNNQWLSLRAGTGIVPGMEIVTTSATTIASRTLTSGTYTTSLGATVTMGQQAVATMSATPGSPGPHLLHTNTAITALVNRTGNDETGTTYGYIGSLAGSLQFIDYELSGVLTAQGAWTAADHGRLVAYYGGGS